MYQTTWRLHLSRPLPIVPRQRADERMALRSVSRSISRSGIVLVVPIRDGAEAEFMRDRPRPVHFSDILYPRRSVSDPPESATTTDIPRRTSSRCDAILTRVPGIAPGSGTPSG